MKETKFKQTDWGLFPDDWDVKVISEIADNYTGLTYHPENVKRHGILVLRSSNIQNGRLCFDDNVFVEMEIPERAFVKTGDVLVCVRNGSSALIGKSALITEEAEGMAFGAFMTVLRAKGINNKYLHFIWQTNNVQKQVHETFGATINQITSKDFNRIVIPVPPRIAEQERIAEALSDVDGLLRELDAEIAKKRAIKQGAMQELLTGKRRLEGFTGEWKKVRIKDIFEVTRGYVLAATKTSNMKTSSNPYPVYSSQTTNAGVMGFYNQYLFEDCITWTTDGANAGDVHFRKGKFYCTNVCGVLKSDVGYANECVAGILSLCSKKHVSYVGNPKLMNNVMAEIEITIPTDTNEQTAIANILSDMDEEIAALEAKRAKYEQVKQGMMQELLTGRIRLINN